MIRQALAKVEGGSVVDAAKWLGISYQLLTHRIRKKHPELGEVRSPVRRRSRGKMGRRKRIIDSQHNFGPPYTFSFLQLAKFLRPLSGPVTTNIFGARGRASGAIARLRGLDRIFNSDPAARAPGLCCRSLREPSSPHLRIKI